MELNIKIKAAIYTIGIVCGVVLCAMLTVFTRGWFLAFAFALVGTGFVYSAIYDALNDRQVARSVPPPNTELCDEEHPEGVFHYVDSDENDDGIAWRLDLYRSTVAQAAVDKDKSIIINSSTIEDTVEEKRTQVDCDD